MNQVFLRTLIVSAILGLSMLGLTTRAWADSKEDPSGPKAKFTMSRGKGVKVCEAYKQYLASTSEYEVMCERRIPSDAFPQFTQPSWKEFDPRERLATAVFVLEASRDLSYRPPPPKRKADNESAYEGEVRENYEYGRDRWFSALYDIDNDGHGDALIKFEDGPCTTEIPSLNHYAVPIMVMSADGGNVDEMKSRKLMSIRPDAIGIPGMTSFDVFAFDGKVYVDRWKHEPGGRIKGKGVIRSPSHFLSISLHQDGKTSTVCEYRFPITSRIQ